MRNYLLLLFFFVTSQLYAQDYTKMFQLENYKHTLTYPDHKITFNAQPAGKTIRYTAPDKKYYWFSNNQIKITQGGYSGKLLHGLYSDFYLNNNLKEQGKFKMGLKEGEWKNWTADGLLIATTNYRTGITEGDFYKYDSLGHLIAAGKNSNGKINGQLKKYINADSVVIIKYKNGIVQEKNSSWLKKILSKKRTPKPTP